jgi:hypothetical protein
MIYYIAVLTTLNTAYIVYKEYGYWKAVESRKDLW